MPHGIPRKHIIGRLGRSQAKPVPPQDLEENAQNLHGTKDQGFFACLGRRVHEGQEGEPAEQKKEAKRKEQDIAKDAQ